MSSKYGLINSLFVVMGWEVSYDSNGFTVCSVPEGKELNDHPSTWSSGEMPLHVFIDGVSYEEDKIISCGSYIHVEDGSIHMAMLSCMSPYVRYMIKHKLSFIIFPNGVTRDKMIESILEVFPGKYDEDKLRSKKIVSSTGYRKCLKLYDNEDN